jgi:hypothetical protein
MGDRMQLLQQQQPINKYLTSFKAQPLPKYSESYHQQQPTPNTPTAQPNPGNPFITNR